MFQKTTHPSQAQTRQAINHAHAGGDQSPLSRAAHKFQGPAEANLPHAGDARDELQHDKHFHTARRQNRRRAKNDVHGEVEQKGPLAPIFILLNFEFRLDDRLNKDNLISGHVARKKN